MLINTLIQTKIIGDKKMQLSQQMLDATERESKKLKIAQQKNGRILKFEFIFKSIYIYYHSSGIN
jgi:hypothetical protein